MISFACLGVAPERYAASPSLTFKLRVTQDTGGVHAIALRVQIRIEPSRRRYDAGEGERLSDLFGEAPRWAETMRPMTFAHAQTIVPAFDGCVDVDLPVACTYDFEVASAKYLHAIRDGDVPLLLLFSGTVFERTEHGYAVSQIPWNVEARHAMPARTWHDLMDLHFPGSAWIRVRRDTFDALQAYKAAAALPTWDQALEKLLGDA